jgi:hypothetical protein
MLRRRSWNETVATPDWDRWKFAVECGSNGMQPAISFLVRRDFASKPDRSFQALMLVLFLHAPQSIEFAYGPQQLRKTAYVYLCLFDSALVARDTTLRSDAAHLPLLPARVHRVERASAQHGHRCCLALVLYVLASNTSVRLLRDFKQDDSYMPSVGILQRVRDELAPLGGSGV